MNRYIMIRRLRGPAFLLLIGVIALLHPMGIIHGFWQLFWPLLLILLGVLLLAERAALAADGGIRLAISRCADQGAPIPARLGRSAYQRQPDRRSSLHIRTTSGKIRMEGNHEQRASEYPPGGGAPPPYPPYDPKTQWRVYREQQKAAWRAQRDAWKAQRYAWKADYAGAYGPRVPSIVGPVILIGVGVVALLVLTGHITAAQFWTWYGRWWPLLLIGAGPGPAGGVGAGFAPEDRRCGAAAALLASLSCWRFWALGRLAWNHVGPWFNHWNNDNDDFFNIFGLPEHDNDQQVAERADSRQRNRSTSKTRGAM